MTDFTSDTPVPAQGRHRVAAERREYIAYFALIFMATLPLALLTWALTAARHFRLPEKDPISRAWTQARIITPHIFAA
jgi:PufQ cytochrome subunit.